MPAPALQLLAAGTEHRFPNDGPAFLVVRSDWSPPALQLETAETLRAVNTEIIAYLTPAGADWLSARVAALMAHYWIADAPESLHAALVDDWLDVLGGFPRWAIGEAVSGWLATERRKPLPADIAARCRIAVREWGALAYLLRVALEAHDAVTASPGSAERIREGISEVASLSRQDRRGSRPVQPL